MELQNYFSPIQNTNLLPINLSQYEQRFASIDKYDKEFPNVAKYDIAIIGIAEDRNSPNKGCAQAPDALREQFYKLFVPHKKIKIVDCGNLRPGVTIADTYVAVLHILFELIQVKTVPIIIGGTQDLTSAIYNAYVKLEQQVNLTSIDARINLGGDDTYFNSETYLSKIILDENANLFHFSNIGYQTYLVAPEEIKVMNDMFFDVFRLGVTRTNLAEIEPIIRDSDVISFDVSAIRQAEAPGQFNPSPNGIDGEEACQLARYAGMSDKVSCFGLFEINPSFDINNHTVHLGAQVIWYFIEGFYHRQNEYPFTGIDNCSKFIVSIEEGEHEMVFYKSKKSARWWLEVPYPQSEYNRRKIVTCSYEDYVRASNNEIPDRWWKTYQKLH